MSTLITDRIQNATTALERSAQQVVDTGARVSFRISGSGTASLGGEEYGASSLTDNGTGDYTVNLSITFDSATEDQITQARPLAFAGSVRGAGGSTTSARFQSFSTSGVNTDGNFTGYLRGDLA